MQHTKLFGSYNHILGKAYILALYTAGIHHDHHADLAYTVSVYGHI